MKVKGLAWWVSWDSISGKISLRSKCYMIRKHCPFLGWLNQNTFLLFWVIFFFSWLTALICIIMALCVADLVSSGRLELLTVTGNPWGHICHHSQNPVCRVLPADTQREAGFSAVLDPLVLRRLAGLTQNQRCTLFSSARGRVPCGF